MPKPKAKQPAKSESAPEAAVTVEDEGYKAGQLTQLLQSTSAPANQDSDLVSLFCAAPPDATPGPQTKKRKLLSKAEADLQEQKKQKKKKAKLEQQQVPLDEDEVNRAALKARAKLVKQRQLARESDPRNSRTVFVGNVSSAAKKRDLLLLFRQHGPIESVRFRSAAPADASVVKRLAVIHKKLSRPSLNAYLVYKEDASVAKAIEALNGHCLCGMHMRVDSVQQRNGLVKDDNKCVFLGNLHFKCDEESVRGAFAQCGRVTNVRLVRDSRTGVGRGFGFVQFADAASVELALKLTGTDVAGRSIRVTRCSAPESQQKQRKAEPRTKDKGVKYQKLKKSPKSTVDRQQRTGKPNDKRRQASRPTNRTFAQAFERMLDKRRAAGAKKLDKQKKQSAEAAKLKRIGK